MWVQVHDLPVGLMKEKVGTTLANYIGAFLEYDKNNNSSFWRQYMRIRVKINVQAPLKKDTKVMDKEGKWCTVKFKYEKLGIFCFVCGVMGHTENKCEVRFAMEVDDGTRQWSADIRADSRRQGGRLTSRWLKEERGGVAQQGDGATARDQNGAAMNPQSGPTNADVAHVATNNIPKIPVTNHAAIISKQNHSLTIDDRYISPATQFPKPFNSSPNTLHAHASSSHSQHKPAFISPTFQISNAFSTSHTADNILTPYPLLNSPIIISQPETDTHNSQSFPHQIMTFTSQPDPQHSILKTTRSARANSKNLSVTRTITTPMPDPILTRTRPEKKTKQTITMPKPTQPLTKPSPETEKLVDMETQSEKKRRREEETSVNNDQSQATEHFLTAGPGSQDCRDQ
jgi:hypothetical protein